MANTFNVEELQKLKTVPERLEDVKPALLRGTELMKEVAEESGAAKFIKSVDNFEQVGTQQLLKSASELVESTEEVVNYYEKLNAALNG